MPIISDVIAPHSRAVAIERYYKCKLCKRKGEVSEVPSSHRILHLRNYHHLNVKKKWRDYYEG